jgi:PAS domain S-box-containing protein
LAQKAAEKGKLKGSNLVSAGQEIQHVIDALPFHVLLVDSYHSIVAANNAVKQDLGMSSEQLIGMYCPRAVHGCNDPIAECPLAETLKKGDPVERDVFDSLHARWLNLAVYPTKLFTFDGNPIYLHFAHDITQTKQTADSLSRSLEHNSALRDLLQKLQYCQNSTQVLEVLIDQVSSLSWLGMAATAVGFLVKEQSLEIAAQRNLGPEQLKRCDHLAFGECLCGRVAQTGIGIVCSSTSSSHTIQHEGMGEHQHAIIPISHEGRTLGILTLYLNSGDQLDTFRLDFLKAAAAAAGATLAGQVARENSKRIREKSMAKVISQQEDERKRIAGELHDQVCQSLSALLLQVQTHGSQHGVLKDVAQDCEARIRGLIDEVRLMAGQLRPTILDDYGLELALARHIQELSLTHTDLAIDYQYVAQEPQNRLPVPVEVSLYRVAMEALSNIISHASASRASVVILWRHAKVLLLVEDNGRGFDYSTIRRDIDRCLGLIDMEERITLMGGTLRIESTPQQGTTIRAEIPMETTH